MSLSHPVLPLLLALACLPWVGQKGRRWISLAGPLAALAMLWALPAEARLIRQVLGHEWTLLHADALARVFGTAFTAYAFVAGLYAWREPKVGVRASALGLAAGGVGVALAGDFLTLFLCWEWLTVCSLYLVWSGNSPASYAAGLRYFIVHLAGGVCLLGGVLLHGVQGGSWELAPLSLDGVSSWMILLGLLTNAAVPPLHAWLPDAYPRATPIGSVFLSAFTTKAAVCVLIRVFPGVELLVWAGALMALYGVVFAVLENDIRRLLGYHIISQVGYMVCGVGLGTELALNGAAAHAFCHIFYKGLLMMAAGAVIHATGRGKLTELGGLAAPLRGTLVCCLIGAFSISGVPLFNGFVSKSMIVSASAYSGAGTVELMLLIASMGTFLHTGLKLPWFVFFGPQRAPEVRAPVPPSMLWAMVLASGACILTGIAPGWLYAQLPYPVNYHPFTADHVVGALQILLGTALGFWLLRAHLAGEPTVTRDVDRIYRRTLPALSGLVGKILEACGRRATHTRETLVARVWTAWSRSRVHVLRARLAENISVIVACLIAVAMALFARWH